MTRVTCRCRLVQPCFLFALLLAGTIICLGCTARSTDQASPATTTPENPADLPGPGITSSVDESLPEDVASVDSATDGVPVEEIPVEEIPEDAPAEAAPAEETPQEETPAPRAESPLERYERLVSEANAANAAWARDLKALRDAEKAGGPPVPASAWTSPLIPFVARFQAAARDHAGTDAAIPFLMWVTQNAMPMKGAGRQAAKDSLHELVTTHRRSNRLVELSWMLGRLVYFFGEEEGAAIGAGLEADSPNEEVRTWAVFSRTTGFLESAPVDSDAFKGAIAELRAALAKVDMEMLAEEVENRIAVRERFSIGMVAPDIQGVDLAGNAFALSDYGGKVVLLDFWGDW